jgi:hypothetical protein
MNVPRIIFAVIGCIFICMSAFQVFIQRRETADSISAIQARMAAVFLHNYTDASLASQTVFQDSSSNFTIFIPRPPCLHAQWMTPRSVAVSGSFFVINCIAEAVMMDTGFSFGTFIASQLSMSLTTLSGAQQSCRHCSATTGTQPLILIPVRLTRPFPGYGAFYWLIFLTLKNATIAVNMNYDREALESKRLKMLGLWLGLAVVFVVSHALMYAFERIAYLAAWLIALSISMMFVGMIGWMSVWQVKIIMRAVCVNYRRVSLCPPLSFCQRHLILDCCVSTFFYRQSVLFRSTLSCHTAAARRWPPSSNILSSRCHRFQSCLWRQLHCRSSFASVHSSHIILCSGVCPASINFFFFDRFSFAHSICFTPGKKFLDLPHLALWRLVLFQHICQRGLVSSGGSDHNGHWPLLCMEAIPQRDGACQSLCIVAQQL